MICGSVVTHTVGRQKMVPFSHLIYLVQLSYFGKLSNLANHEFDFK